MEVKITKDTIKLDDVEEWLATAWANEWAKSRDAIVISRARQLVLQKEEISIEEDAEGLSVDGSVIKNKNEVTIMGKNNSGCTEKNVMVELASRKGIKEQGINLRYTDVEGFCTYFYGDTVCYEQGAGKMFYDSTIINHTYVDGYFGLVRLSLKEGVDIEEVRQKIHLECFGSEKIEWHIPFGRDDITNCYGQVGEKGLILAEVAFGWLKWEPGQKTLFCFPYDVIKDYVDIKDLSLNTD